MNPLPSWMGRLRWCALVCVLRPPFTNVLSQLLGFLCHIGLEHGRIVDTLHFLERQFQVSSSDIGFQLLHTAGTWDDHYFGVSRQPGECHLGWRCPVASAYVTKNFYNRWRSPEVIAVEDAEAGPQVPRHIARTILATK